MAAISKMNPPTELRDKIAQLLFMRIGSNLDPIRTVEEDEQRISELIGQYSLGGLLLFNGRWPATRDTLKRLQRIAKYPLLVCSDIERGVGQQIRGIEMFPHAVAFGILGENPARAIEQFVKVTAHQARECGIHVSFAPVADVNTDPRNPVISTRAFGSDPHQAADLVATYVRAAEAVGLPTTAKHFPGHGHTDQDSHDSLPVVDRTLAELEACDLIPFQAAIDAGVSVVMTAHVSYSQIEPSGLPATLSSGINVDLLREKMGFRGAVCSDSLMMAGVRDRFETEGEMALATLNAGVDMLLDVVDVAAILDYLCRAVDDGTLAESRIEAALENVWKLKAATGATKVTLSGDVDLSCASGIAMKATTVEQCQSPRFALPLDTNKSVDVLLLVPKLDWVLPADKVLKKLLTNRFSAVNYLEIQPEEEASNLQDIVGAACRADQLVVAMVVKPAAWQKFGLSAEQREIVSAVAAARPLVLASLGVPYVLEEFDADYKICTYSDVPVSQQALVQLLTESH